MLANVLSILSLIVAFGTLAFSFFTYFTHDLELKKQEKQINDFHLSSLERSEAESKQAKIRGNIIPSSTKGNRILKIFNAGQAVAKNVSVEWLNPADDVMVHWEFGLIGDITPQNGRQYHISLCEGHPETMRLRYTWADDNKDNNVFEEDVQL